MYAISKKSDGKGCSSKFYFLKGKTNRGFKEFSCYEDAVIAHYNQYELAKYDLAPEVYSQVGRVRVGRKQELSRWGYITEVAELIVCPGNECYCCDRATVEYDMEEEISNLCYEMEDNGFYFGDNHIGNVGYVQRNGVDTLVCIDTGDESVSSENGPCFCLECKKGNNCRA